MPNQTPAFDPTDTALKEKVKNQKNVTELFPELSYEELAAVMDTWLNSSQENAEDAEPATPVATEEPEAPAPAPAPKSATAKAAVKTPTSTKAIADEFNDLFNS